MFRFIHNKVWCFDAEWVPDPETGRILYKLPEEMSDEEVIQEMWKHGGASEENPTPYLKTTLCRVISISAVTRTITNNGVQLRLLSLPRDQEHTSEADIIDAFLGATGKHKPQLVGYNSKSSDIKILIQRAIANGLQAKEFCRRPPKPWEGVDYFARISEFNIDLMEIVGGWGKSAPSLNQLAAACKIPGKIDIDGDKVVDYWLKSDLEKIVAYNEFDALTTYLLWLKTACFGGMITLRQYQDEQLLLYRLLTQESETEQRPHLKKYIEEWKKLDSDISP